MNALIIFMLAVFFLLLTPLSFAQAQSETGTISGTSSLATSTATSTATTSEEFATTTTEVSTSTSIAGIEFEKADLTRPEQDTEKQEILELLSHRPVESLSFFTIFPFWVQEAIAVGIPANTIVLILLIPILATIVTFVRTIVGLPSLEMLVPIILSFVFVAVGVVIGLVVLAAVMAASFVSRRLLRKAQLMYFPKRSISLLLLSFFVFAALTVAIAFEPTRISELSIFPILILTLLGDSLVSVQLHKSMRETMIITLVTIFLGLIGFLLATMVPVRNLIILYPEVVLLTLPLNLIMGRYFGLRLSEVIRFRTFQTYGGE